MKYRIMRYVNRIHRTSILDRQHALEEAGLSGYQVSYLLAVGRNDGMLQDQLVNKMYVNKSSITRQLSSLEEKGFIRREPDPTDRRRLQLWLTEKGQATLPLIRQAIDAWTEELLEDFSDEEKESLVKMLRILARKSTLRVERLGLAGSRSSDSDEVKDIQHEGATDKQ